MRNSYKLHNGEMIINSHENKELWRDKPFGIPIVDWKQIPNSEDIVVLLDYRQIDIKQHRNILRINPNGQIVWEVAPPLELFRSIKIDNENDNLYTGITKINQEILRAFAFCGYSDTIDLNNGNVIGSEFVK